MNYSGKCPDVKISACILGDVTLVSRTEKAYWLCEDGEVHFAYARDFMQALQDVMGSPAFQDHSVVENAVRYVFPTAMFDMDGERVTIGGGLYYGAHYAVGGSVIRVGWMMELSLKGLSGSIHVHIKIAQQCFILTMGNQAQTAKFWGMETGSLLSGPIILSFSRATAQK